jgi:hypothetical protein
MFETKRRQGGDAFIGKSVRITSNRVDERFGTAIFHDGAVRMDISVRADSPNTLARGQDALIIGFDAERHIYFVEGVLTKQPERDARSLEQEIEQLEQATSTVEHRS